MTGGEKPTQTVKRTRTSKPKVKTGCKTCKKRGTKCDEGRPACQRCVSTGRTCDGYGIWGGGGNGYGSKDRSAGLLKPAKHLTSYTIPSQNRTVSQEEKMAFDFFRRRTAVKLPGVFDSGFWDTLVFQASLKEPAVLHALIALGAVHQSVAALQEPADSTHISQHEKLALKQYNKAISHLGVHFQKKDKDSLRVALITCMVFICIELLRERFEAANTHVSNGINILSEIQIHGQCSDSTPINHHGSVVDDYLIQAFTRLNIHSALYKDGSPYLYLLGQNSTCGPSYSLPQTFQTTAIARLFLDGLMNGIHYLTTQIESHLLTHSSLPPSFLLRHKQLQAALLQWHQTFDRCLPIMLANANPRSAYGLPLLRIYHSMAHILLSTCLSPSDEMAYDAHTPSFASIIAESYDLWKRVTPSCGDTEHGFTVDMGFIPPLYYTALKCRVRGLRRLAVRFLRMAPHREWVWDGELVANIAEAIVGIEEEGMDGYCGFEGDVERYSGPVVYERPVVPEAARVKSASAVRPEGMGKKLTLVCRTCGGEEFTKDIDIACQGAFWAFSDGRLN